VIWQAYVRSTKGGGALVKSTSSGGSATIQTTSAAGGGQTTSAGGGQTSSENGSHYHRLFVGGNSTSTNFPKRRYFAYLKDQDVATSVNFEADTGGDIYTYEAEGSHTHDIADHVHYTDDHTHQVTVETPSHNHVMNIPEHQHEMEFGIFEFERLPTAVSIKVDGTEIPHTAISGEDIDLIPYLQKDDDGRIIRGRWVTIEIAPNDLARINAVVVNRVFISSHEGGGY
jgi:hypothetical protein